MLVQWSKIAGAGALLAAMAVLSACRWGAASPLVAGEEADASPIAPGQYAWTGDAQYYYSVQGAGAAPVQATYHGREGDTLYTVRFDRLDAEFYLVEASNANERGVGHGLIRVTPAGFDQIALNCGPPDGAIALAAGAVRDGDAACIFGSYANLRRAAEEVAARIREDEAQFTVTSYRAVEPRPERG